MTSIRIQKAMAHLGFGSRRSCEKMVAEGRVTLDGELVQIGQTLSESEVQRLVVDGKSVGAMPKKLYILLHKPRGYVTTVSDPQGRSTVMELLPEQALKGKKRVYPVGRLDRETTGVLLFTNDGRLAHGLLHPSSGVEKEYHATVDAVPTESQLAQLRAGPTLDDGPTSPPHSVSSKGKNVTLVIKEGRKRQVRRMLKEVGLRCRHLDRVRFGNLTYEGLKPGERRSLDEAELTELRKLCPQSS